MTSDQEEEIKLNIGVVKVMPVWKWPLMDEGIILLGKVPLGEKFYQSLDGYVCLSAYEGCSLSTLEAMSLGVPVVSSSQNGVLFDARIKRPDLPLAEVKDIKDEKEATELVRKILCDIKFREEIIRSGLEITQSLSWKDVAQTYEQRYKSFKAS